MKKNITLTILGIIVLSWLVTYHTTEPRKNFPTNPPFIIKSNLPGTCRVSTVGTYADTKQNMSVTACKVQL